MSAFVVSHDTIDKVIEAGIRTRVIEPDDATADGKLLLEENVRSVRYRYPEDPNDLPGPILGDGVTFDDYVNAYTFLRSDASTGELKGAVECLDYQSCELPDWETSHAGRMVRAIEDRLARTQATGWGH